MQKLLEQYEPTMQTLNDIVTRVSDGSQSESMTQDIITAMLFNDVLKTDSSFEIDSYGSVFVTPPDESKKIAILHALQKFEQTVKEPQTSADGVIKPGDGTAEIIESRLRELTSQNL